ncbi:phosphocholine-specific phospholipase C [Actinomadura sp. 6N118]|uniref:phosphocholine-specific phospholipase C n=1 Tax=Actinomadura sp. 6N118 TaxID=3375151 RepID=UPI003789AEB1
MSTGHGPSRRKFLASSATVASGAAVASVLPPSVHQALARPVRPGGLKAIKHVVLLMQENRSFDHYFGALRGVRGFGDRNAITLPTGKSIFEQPDGAGTGAVLPFPLRTAAELAKKDLQWMGSLPHGWSDGHEARADGWNSGWIPAKTPATMAYVERRDIPLQYELADTFTICDAYHSSVPSSTSPNRNYFVSGHTGYEPGSTKRAIENDAYSEDTHAGYDWTTYAEELEKAGVSWKVYQEWDNYQDNNLEFFVKFKEIARKVLQGDFKSMDSFYSAFLRADEAKRKQMQARLDEGVAKLPPAERGLFERGLRRVPAGGLAADFRADIKAGKLPAVSYLVPSAADSEHPSASSPIQSARITYDILDAIASDPEIWATTALFITYDEFDGLFDHVPPPVPPESVTGEYYNGDPIGFGFRVPMTVVSPWTVGGYVCSQVFDHTSMTQFMEKWLGVRAPDMGDWRRTVSGDLTSAFDFASAGRRPSVEQPSAVPAFTGRWKPTPPADQKMPAPEPGTRRARPLPYQPEASLSVAKGTLRLSLTNTGIESVHFSLYPYAGELPKPRHFDVARKLEQEIKPGGDAYDLVLIGPNGFRREFAGTARGGADVTSLPQANGGRDVWIFLKNTGDEEVTFTLKALAYAKRDRQVKVKPGKQRKVRWNTDHGWYDVEIKVSGDATFRRRLMGHVENGRPSLSG